MITSQNPGSSSEAPPVEPTAAASSVANPTKTSVFSSESKKSEVEKALEAAIETQDFDQAEILQEEVDEYLKLKNKFEQAISDKKWGEAKILKPQVQAASKVGGLKDFLSNKEDKRIANEKAEKERLQQVHAIN